MKDIKVLFLLQKGWEELRRCQYAIDKESDLLSPSTKDKRVDEKIQEKVLPMVSSPCQEGFVGENVEVAPYIVLHNPPLEYGTSIGKDLEISSFNVNDGNNTSSY